MVSLSRLVLPDGLTFELNGPCTVGRSPANTLALANDHISRKHALIQVQGDGECWMVDLGSSNGTYVNGRRVSRPLVLKNGDLIEMAGSRIEFQTEGSTADYETTGGSTLRDIKRRNCWLMVADIVDSTRMALELPPEEFPQVTGGWFNTCRELIEAHGGHMNQYTGDGFFCYWEDTFDAKSRILDAMRALGQLQVKATPGFRVVVHHGETVFSSVPNTSEQNLHGREVHFAFRMEKLAGAWKDSWLLSDAAFQALGVKSIICRASQVGGYDGIYQFHVPDFNA
ncbi:MAG: FHA domain-containing protein [Verrucomicrobiota bacterium]